MTEAMRDSFHAAGAPAGAGAWARAVNGAPLRLRTRPPGPEPLDGSLCWYDPAAGEFLPTRHELADDRRRLAAGKRQAEARAEASDGRVAELEARIEKMQRG